MKIHEIKYLIYIYGGDTKLNDILKMIQGNKKYVCPKCNGSGSLKIKYNAYPPGLPDSGFVDDWRYKYVDCDLCNGEGYTDKEYVPRMVQDGFEIKS